VKATKVNAGLAESNGRLLLGIWRDSLHVTCGQTACTPGSAPGPALGNEYGKTFFTTLCIRIPSLYVERGVVVSVFVGMFLRPRASPISTSLCVGSFGRGSVLLWRRQFLLCTRGVLHRVRKCAENYNK